MSQALRCALSLREEMGRLNESRKLDGKKPLKQGMGIARGPGARGPDRGGTRHEASVTGEALPARGRWIAWRWPRARIS